VDAAGVELDARGAAANLFGSVHKAEGKIGGDA